MLVIALGVMVKLHSVSFTGASVKLRVVQAAYMGLLTDSSDVSEYFVSVSQNGSDLEDIKETIFKQVELRHLMSKTDHGMG